MVGIFEVAADHSSRKEAVRELGGWESVAGLDVGRHRHRHYLDDPRHRGEHRVDGRPFSIAIAEALGDGVLAVATARNPAASTAPALAGSQAFGRTSGRPGTWRLRRCSAFATRPSITDDLASGSTDLDIGGSRPKGTVAPLGNLAMGPVVHDVRMLCGPL